MRSIFSQLFLFAGLLAGPAAGLAQEGAAAPVDEGLRPPTVTLEAPAVTVSWGWIVPGPGGEGEQLVPVPPADAAQAQAVERLGTVRFRYEGEVAAGALQIEVAVPPELQYIPDSATGPGAETDYLPEPRRVQWLLPGPLEPGTTGLVSFRAVPRPPEDVEAAEAGP
ncbi:hypothetical protein [Thioalkalivibrio sp. XN8]|uniref:hypothetical protein n=1 Tax=Thioalkalivibrio sp. XN8 TaxID=2712863 RepID=UPI0013EBB797|nr:hypothetical protein [Thioalkalivibrio sp. XN8]NGP53647.1 hypothetical protein [Thioalkalivibrio sp. XN8]